MSIYYNSIKGQPNSTNSNRINYDVPINQFSWNGNNVPAGQLKLQNEKDTNNYHSNESEHLLKVKHINESESEQRDFNTDQRDVIP